MGGVHKKDLSHQVSYCLIMPECRRACRTIRRRPREGRAIFALSLGRTLLGWFNYERTRNRNHTNESRIKIQDSAKDFQSRNNGRGQLKDVI